MAFVWLAFFIVLIVAKVWLMRSVWLMAGQQGKSQWLCLIASIFAAWIVWLALWANEHSLKQQQRFIEGAE